MSETKVIKAWGGFSEGKLDEIPHNDAYDDGGFYARAIFLTRKSAKLRYEDVRRIEIHIPTPSGLGEK